MDSQRIEIQNAGNGSEAVERLSPRASAIAYLGQGYALRKDGVPVRIGACDQPYELGRALRESAAQALTDPARRAFAPDSVITKSYIKGLAERLLPAQLTPETQLVRQELLGVYERFKATLRPSDRVFFKVRFEERARIEVAADRAGLSPRRARSAERRLRQGFLGFMRASGYLES